MRLHVQTAKMHELKLGLSLQRFFLNLSPLTQGNAVVVACSVALFALLSFMACYFYWRSTAKVGSNVGIV